MKFHEAHFEGERREEEPEPTAKAYYDMLATAQQPLHGHTKVSQLDAIGRLMAAQFTLSRDAFYVMLQVIGSMLPEGRILPKSMYEAQKLLRALKMSYEQILACPKGCILFRKEHAEAKYCPKYEQITAGVAGTMSKSCMRYNCQYISLIGHS